MSISFIPRLHLSGERIPHLFQIFPELQKCLGTLAYCVFFYKPQLRQAALKTVDQKERIVSEAPLSSCCKENPSGNPAGKQSFNTFRGYKRQHADKCRLALFIGNILTFAQKQGVIGGIPGPFTGKTSRINAGTAIQGVNHQAGIVSQRRKPGKTGRLASFFEGIFLERGPVLNSLGKIEKIGSAADPINQTCQQRIDFKHLALITGRYYQMLHRASASCWNSKSCFTPPKARSRMASISVLVKGSASAVPCTSTKRPLEVMTKFISTSAEESSR